MKIKELIKKLQTYNPEHEVYLSGDPEGNDIRTIDSVASTTINKTNNEGDYDIVVIWPTDTFINQ
jgi:hypothetical protein